MHNFYNHIKYRGEDAEVKFSFSEGGLDFKGKTKGLAIKYVVEGHEHYGFKQGEALLGKGAFIILRNNEEYLAQGLKQDKIANGICIDLFQNVKDSKLSAYLENDHLFNIPFSCNRSSSLGSILNELAISGMEGDFSQERIADLHLSLQDLNKELYHFADVLKFSVKKVDTQKFLISKFIRARNFIHANYKARINLEDLAKFAGTSKYHFLRLFKLIFDQTPKEMQSQLKIEEAKTLIQNQNASLSEIAIELGFCDLSSFSKSFRKHCGIPPSKYLD